MEASSSTKFAIKSLFILLAINLAASGFILVYIFVPLGRADAGNIDFFTLENGRHVLYIGLNDMHSYYQIIPTEEAIAIVTEIASRHAGGWTMSLAEGGWVDEHGVLTTENSLVWTFIGAEEDAIIAIMREVLSALNQNSILVERNDVTSVFYRDRGNGQ